MRQVGIKSLFLRLSFKETSKDCRNVYFRDKRSGFINCVIIYPFPSASNAKCDICDSYSITLEIISVHYFYFLFIFF